MAIAFGYQLGALQLPQFVDRISGHHQGHRIGIDILPLVIGEQDGIGCRFHHRPMPPFVLAQAFSGLLLGGNVARSNYEFLHRAICGLQGVDRGLDPNVMAIAMPPTQTHRRRPMSGTHTFDGLAYPQNIVGMNKVDCLATDQFMISITVETPNRCRDVEVTALHIQAADHVGSAVGKQAQFLFVGTQLRLQMADHRQRIGHFIEFANM